MFCRVVSTQLSKPETFCTIDTREKTELMDPKGVWQKDRGGRFANYLVCELEIQDAQGNPLPQTEEHKFDLECELRSVLDNGEHGGVLDVINRTNCNIMLKRHLEGKSKKLIILDADTITGRGLQIGGSQRSFVKFRINELSKMGSKNSRYSVLFRVIGSESERFAPVDPNPQLASSYPITIHSKLSKPQPAAVASAAVSTMSLDKIKEMMDAVNDLLTAKQQSTAAEQDDDDQETLQEIWDYAVEIQNKVRALLQTKTPSFAKNVDAPAISSPQLNGSVGDVSAWLNAQVSLSLDTWLLAGTSLPPPPRQ